MTEKHSRISFRPDFSIGNIATIASGCVFALGLFFTFGQQFATANENDKRHDLKDLEHDTQIKELKIAAQLSDEKIEKKIDEINRNVVILLVAMGQKPARGDSQ